MFALYSGDVIKPKSFGKFFVFAGGKMGVSRREKFSVKAPPMFALYSGDVIKPKSFGKFFVFAGGKMGVSRREKFSVKAPPVFALYSGAFVCAFIFFIISYNAPNCNEFCLN